jgi:hypothetical protein
MSRLPRPHIPIPVRVQVAERQLVEQGWGVELGHKPTKQWLDTLLACLFADEKYHLDHDPALVNRVKWVNEAGEVDAYDPPANDPKHLIYRTAAEHKVKTYVRGEGALRSDAGQRRYNKRVAKNREALDAWADGKRRAAKRKIKSRPFSKQHRPFRTIPRRRKGAGP